MNTQDKPIILIADDSRVVRVSLKNILKNDCQLIEAEDGQQAWEQLLESPDIRLIFSDLSMPRLDGRGLLQKIRNSEITRIRNIPFIVVTGNEEETGTRDELLELGATELVNKPFDPARIVSFVSTLVVSQQDSESYMLLHEEENQTDYMQGTPNQKDFLLSASKELSHAIRNKNELAIALMRIDQYDQLETHYSEPAIDHILMTTAEIVRQHIHPDDTMAYFGDGMFAILRPASNAIGTRYIGRRIVEDLSAKQFYLGESDEVVSVSMGISAPQIKPGIRLSELLLLAEGRLKAAIDLGGHRVVDKGNDTLTPVGLQPDSAPGTTADTEISSSKFHSDSIKSSHLRIDAASVLAASASIPDPQELEDKIDRLQSALESIGQENKDLQTQVERLRNQAGDSEQLRRRVFELESEKQQMQIKLNDLSTENDVLQKRADEAESAHRTLVDSEEDKNLTLKQANQFYEQENLRLEGQLEALSSRAQKAELAQRKSEQLIISLKDNIKLLRVQMEQTQNQLLEARQQGIQATQAAQGVQATQAAAPPPGPDRPEVDVDTDPFLNEETHIEQRSDNELVFDPFPTGTPKPSQNEPASVAALFAESETSAIPAAASENNEAKTQAVEPPSPTLSIPVYRPETREKPFREYRPLSSFAIASIIMLLILGLGGGYLYYYWMEASTAPSVSASEASATAETPRETSPAAPAQAATRAEQQHRTATTASAVSNPTSPSTADEEAIFQAELTLRQRAEEEFQRRLQNVEGEARLKTLPMSGENEDFTGAGNEPQTAESSPFQTVLGAPPPARQTNGAEGDGIDTASPQTPLTTSAPLPRE